MARFTQVAFLKDQTPLGADAFLLEAFSAREGLSEPFLAVLDLLAPAETAVPFEKLLGQAFRKQRGRVIIASKAGYCLPTRRRFAAPRRR